jgi:CRP-like cAMP-binding protein
MENLLKRHLEKRLGEDAPNLEKVLSSFEYIKTKRNELLLEKGDVCKYVYYIGSGCLQVYTYDKDLNETTRDIVLEDNWCSDLSSFGSGNASLENIKAIEASELYAINRESFQHLMQTIPQFDMVYKQILEASYVNTVFRLNTFVSLTALERIKWLIEHRPGLMNRVSSKLIASYLGVHKDVYSRLKTKL